MKIISSRYLEFNMSTKAYFNIYIGKSTFFDSLDLYIKLYLTQENGFTFYGTKSISRIL